MTEWEIYFGPPVVELCTIIFMVWYLCILLCNLHDFMNVLPTGNSQLWAIKGAVTLPTKYS